LEELGEEINLVLSGAVGIREFGLPLLDHLSHAFFEVVGVEGALSLCGVDICEVEDRE